MKEPVPFSLLCFECDAGMEIESREQALAEGWTDIQPALEIPQANYLGLCPECKEAEAQGTAGPGVSEDE